MSNVTDEIRVSLSNQTLSTMRGNVNKWLRIGIRREQFRLQQENQMPEFKTSSMIQQLQQAKRDDVIAIATRLSDDIDGATTRAELLTVFDEIVPWVA